MADLNFTKIALMEGSTLTIDSNGNLEITIKVPLGFKFTTKDKVSLEQLKALVQQMEDNDNKIKCIPKSYC